VFFVHAEKVLYCINAR